MRRTLLLLLAMVGVLAVVVPLGTGAPPKPAPSGGMFLIADSTLTAPASSIDISGIPQGYKHLLLVASLRTTTSQQTWDPVRIRFNNDSGPNYANAMQATVGSTLFAHEEADVSGGYTEAMTAASPASSFASVEIHLTDYANTTALKAFDAVSAGLKYTDGAHHVDSGGAWSSTAAINRITLVPDLGPNFVAGSRVTLYGLG